MSYFSCDFALLLLSFIILFLPPLLPLFLLSFIAFFRDPAWEAQANFNVEEFLDKPFKRKKEHTPNLGVFLINLLLCDRGWDADVACAGDPPWSSLALICTLTLILTRLVQVTPLGPTLYIDRPPLVL